MYLTSKILTGWCRCWIYEISSVQHAFTGKTFHLPGKHGHNSSFFIVLKNMKRREQHCVHDHMELYNIFTATIWGGKPQESRLHRSSPIVGRKSAVEIVTAVSVTRKYQKRLLATSTTFEETEWPVEN